MTQATAARPRTQCPHAGMLGARGAGLDGLALARYVTAQVRHSGKHFLAPSLLAALHEVRRRQAGRDPLLDAFLHCALDKFDDRFWNRTYLALPVLELLLDERAGLDPGRLADLLVADIVRFERRADAESHPGRPEPSVLQKRLRHALRFLGQLDDDATADVGLPELTGTAAAWFELTVQRVSVQHDEYFFIRVLQAHEMLFSAITQHLGAAIRFLRADSPERAAAAVHLAGQQLERAGVLFRIAATLHPEAFHDFRQYTQGASAIQSEQYKRFEILCGAPPAERTSSPAFSNVPAVLAEVERQPDSLTQAYQETRTQTADWTAVDRSFARLETAHQRWKTAHHSLAARMLGDAPGSGYTAGVPYLKENLQRRLFWRIGGCPLAR